MSRLPRWEPEDPQFWKETGSAIAWRTCALTTFSLIFSFATWFVMSAVVVRMPAIGFNFTTMELFLARGDTGVGIRNLAADTFQLYPGARNQAGRKHLDHHQGAAHGLAGLRDSGYEHAVDDVHDHRIPHRHGRGRLFLIHAFHEHLFPQKASGSRNGHSGRPGQLRGEHCPVCGAVDHRFCGSRSHSRRAAALYQG